jgi:type VI secretion system protein ImpB
MDESRQHWLDRNRPPRVQITYDVETLGATVKQEIPFVVGVLGDFTGSTDPAAAARGKKLADRRFVEIDRDNFGQVMGSLHATLDLAADDAKGLPGKTLRQVKRPDQANGGARYDVLPQADPIAVSLKIEGLEDFGPRRILEQLGQADPAGPLAKMMHARQYLGELLVKIQGGVWSKDRVLPASVASLKAVDAQADVVQAALDGFAAGGTPPKVDTAVFGTEAAAAFTAAQGAVAAPLAAFKDKITPVKAILTPAATDLAALKDAAGTLDALRTAVDAAGPALTAGVAAITGPDPQAAARAAARTTLAAIARLDELIASAKAVTDLADKYFTPAPAPS